MHTHRLTKTWRELRLLSPRRPRLRPAPPSPEATDNGLIALVCPKCGRVRYFPKAEELYTDNEGLESTRRCDRC